MTHEGVKIDILTVFLLAVEFDRARENSSWKELDGLDLLLTTRYTKKQTPTHTAITS